MHSLKWQKKNVNEMDPYFYSNSLDWLTKIFTRSVSDPTWLDAYNLNVVFNKDKIKNWKTKKTKNKFGSQIRPLMIMVVVCYLYRKEGVEGAVQASCTFSVDRHQQQTQTDEIQFKCLFLFFVSVSQESSNWTPCTISSVFEYCLLYNLCVLHSISM